MEGSYSSGRSLTDAQVRCAAQAYRAGIGLEQLALSLGVSRTTLTNYLVRAGVEIRPKGVRTTLTEPTVARFVEMYQSGDSLPSVAAAYGIAHSTVGEHLKAAGIKLRRRGARPKLTAAEIDIAIRRYQAGESSTAIGADLNVSNTTMIRYLRTAGVTIKARGARPKLSPADITNAVERLGTGQTLAATARSIGVSRVALAKRIEETGTTVGAIKKSAPKRPVAVAAELYATGQPLSDAARKCGISVASLNHHLARSGASRNPYRMADQMIAAGTNLEEVTQRYLGGETAESIGRSLNVSGTTVSRNLSVAGVKMRGRGGRQVNRKEKSP